MKTKLQGLPHQEYKKLSDEELIHRYVHRHEQVPIEVLYERYGHLVLGVCNKYLNDLEAARDATQLIFIKLLDDLKKYTIENFRPWLFRVARNHCLMELRTTIPVVHTRFDEGVDMEFEDEMHHKVENESMLEKLEDALTQLNTEQRTCIELFYLQKMTYSEISTKTGYPVLQVKSCIQNGKRNLKIKMESAGGVSI